MIRFIWAQMRGRPRRTLALLAGVLAATTGFTVLSADAAISQLRINDAVEANYRPAYDILVRPKGSRTGLEEEHGLVRPNYLSGLFGGITMAQLEKVRSAGQVEVAAPIAMLGYSRIYLEQTVDLTDQLDPAARTQVFRINPSWVADRGLTVLGDAPQYVYVTRDRLISQLLGGPGRAGNYEDGTPISDRFTRCTSVLQVRPDGSKAELCLSPMDPGGDGTSTAERTLLQTTAIGADGRFTTVHPIVPRPAADRLLATVSWDVMVLAAAIDPDAEAELVGLDTAVVSGRFLSTSDKSVRRTDPGPRDGFTTTYLEVPALVASTPYVDEQLRVGVERLGADSATAIAGQTREQWVPALAGVQGTPSGPASNSAVAPEIAQNGPSFGFMYQSGPTQYEVDSTGALHPRTLRCRRTCGASPLTATPGRRSPTSRPCSRSTTASGRCPGWVPSAAISPKRNGWGSSIPTGCADSRRCRRFRWRPTRRRRPPAPTRDPGNCLAIDHFGPTATRPATWPPRRWCSPTSRCWTSCRPHPPSRAHRSAPSGSGWPGSPASIRTAGRWSGRSRRTSQPRPGWTWTSPSAPRRRRRPWCCRPVRAAGPSCDCPKAGRARASRCSSSRRPTARA